MNSDWIQAVELGASGVHLTSQQDPREVKREGLSDFLVGQSVHSLRAALRAEDGGADYLIAGPVFDPLSKASHKPLLGMEGLEAIIEAVSIPVFPVGGIHRENQEEVLQLGVAGVCGITWMANEIEANLGVSEQPKDPE